MDDATDSVAFPSMERVETDDFGWQWLVRRRANKGHARPVDMEVKFPR